jgi:DedD protein
MSELYKDKIEVSLDGRQVFYLFFGGAIIVGLVFVLGVMVGKRVEARAHLDRPATSATRDPLAALDRLATDGPNEQSFRQALTGGAAPASDVDRQIAEIEKTRATAAGIEPAKLVEPAKAEEPAKKPDEAKKPDDAKKPDAKKVVEPKVEAKPVTEPAEVDPPKPKKGRFTLQLSAFQDKSEAEAFMAEVKAAGFEAYLTEANVVDKGTFFRVRLGSYPTYDDAVVAKGDFERKVKKIAYVSRI